MDKNVVNKFMVREVAQEFLGKDFFDKRPREFIAKKFSYLTEEERNLLLILAEEYLFIQNTFTNKYFSVWLYTERPENIRKHFMNILPVSRNRDLFLQDILSSYFANNLLEMELTKIIASHISSVDVRDYKQAQGKKAQKQAIYMITQRICNQNQFGKLGNHAFKRIMTFVYQQVYYKSKQKRSIWDFLFKWKKKS